MNLVDRVKKICLTPGTEWDVIAGESSPNAALVSSYIAPLAGVSALAGFIGNSFVGTALPFVGTYRAPILAGLSAAVFTFVMAIVGTFIVGVIINALAPTFAAEKNSSQAFKVAAYSFTPAWVAGVLQVLPLMSLLVLLGSLYSLYLLYLGLPKLMKCPQDKAVPYTVVVVICAIVLSIVVGMVAASIGGAGMAGPGGLGGAVGGGQTTLDPASPLGQLEKFGKQMEAAQKTGDPAAQAAATIGAMGALLGGGARVDPVAIDELKPFLPETFAGLARTGSKAERTGMAGIMVSTAQADYGGGDKTATLEVQDTGGVSGLVGLASWMGVEGEREDESGSERNRRVNGRLTHERVSKTGGSHEFGVVIADRFIVSAAGRGVTLDELKAAVSALALDKLEGMKKAGAPGR